MDSKQSRYLNPTDTNDTAQDAGPAGSLAGGRVGRSTALKALGAALIGGVLGGSARPQTSEAKQRTKKRSKNCARKCPPKPRPTPPPAGPKVMWAMVDASGQLVRGSGVVSSKKMSTGAYQVFFEQDVEECAHVAQITYFSAPGEIYTHPNAVDPDSVILFTYDTAQTRRDADKTFHLVVTC